MNPVYSIATSGDRGGRAGRDKAKTGTVQVREAGSGNSYFVVKQFRYRRNDPESSAKALLKAQLWVDSRL